METIALWARHAQMSLRQTKINAPGVVIDYDGQVLGRQSIEDQLTRAFSRSEARIVVMLSHWGFTGAWPDFRKDEVYFVFEILSQTVGANVSSQMEDFPKFPEHPPLWKPKYVAEFIDRTYVRWKAIDFKYWLRDKTDEELAEQQRMHRHYQDLG